MKPLELIRQFIDEYLDGDVDRLMDFNLYRLRDDDVFGCPDRHMDADDTELMRAIYCVLYADVWEGLSPETLQDYTFRGETMNSYRTMFGNVTKETLHEGLDRHHPSPELVQSVDLFQQQVCATVGNMAVLPNRTVPVFRDRGKMVDSPEGKVWKPNMCWGPETLNTYRGIHWKWHDFMDLFLVELHQALNGETKDKYLHALVRANAPYLDPIRGEEGWHRFITGNLLEDYCDPDTLQPRSVSLGYTYWRSWHMTESQYLNEAHRYVDFATNLIHRRSTRIISLLKTKLNN